MATLTVLPSSPRDSQQIGPSVPLSEAGVKSSGGNATVRPGDCRKRASRRRLEDPGAERARWTRSCPDRHRRVETATPQARPSLDHRRLHGLALEVAVGWDFKTRSARLCADRQAHIRQWGACAPKRPFEVRGRASLCCWLPCGSGPAVAPAAPVRGHRRWTGATPRFGMPGSASQRVGMCTPMPPPQGRSRPRNPGGKARIKAHGRRHDRAGEKPREMALLGRFWLLFQRS